MKKLAFEVYGKVQGVYFRKYTKREAERLGLVGWCENSKKGTVVGEVEGQTAAVNAMRHWLGHVGSPSSRIQKLETLKEEVIDQTSFKSFSIRR
uniref:acylphosphatase n=1 Tax=Chromera velia CCMP2878 TaxID=1169474 RepID=A0A0G4IB56_9ALVE|eukprot:Cvel_12654.t1-p1 / transcript=Cvel_12654.t1 / gene=Cvel_12654 / organism=Chromera_velia_CCMP2878 / gene_product=Acylphosphatase-2, putative / transcript_product=Acylphosphatase-2, putative / location=Cvel_scaffold836:9073-11620(+) / protein_length=93 / sequence_SO=supercontig / SO=protein_coding / is_pseudo=false